MTKYLRILLFGLALNCNSLPAAANWLYTPGAGPSAFRSFNSGTTPAGTSACAAANTDCLANVPIDITGTPLFSSGNPGVVSGGPFAVTGTFFQATQPVSAAALPLPTGAATQTTLASVLSALGSPFQAGGSIGNTAFTANAGTNLNTSLLALESGGNLAQVVTDFGAPGATACSSDTASCNQNQLMQRLAQRLTTINGTLNLPFQAGGSIGNTAFIANAGTNLNTSALGTSANQATIITALNTLNTTAGSPIPQCASLTACNVIGQVQLTPLPRAARNFTGCVVGTSSTNCLAANTAVLYLEVQNTSPSSNVSCKPGGTAVLNDSAGSFMVIPNQAKSWGPNSGGVPTGQLNCIASNASTPIFIEWN